MFDWKENNVYWLKGLWGKKALLVKTYIYVYSYYETKLFFFLKTRNGKEVACTITKLTSGTVVFEDVGSEHFKGQVLKPIDRAQKYASDGDALNGRIKYRAEDRSEVEVPFGEKDQVGQSNLKYSVLLLNLNCFSIP